MASLCAVRQLIAGPRLSWTSKMQSSSSCRCSANRYVSGPAGISGVSSRGRSMWNHATLEAVFAICDLPQCHRLMWDTSTVGRESKCFATLIFCLRNAAMPCKRT
mmetsp:Transcript_65904/g.171059  ORF Transcript_65904/g.171059 Transcript_65904/m.171059 type:complete len:105 (-) Transcript_65904:266-580(-)